jgi:hypothetical protein
LVAANEILIPIQFEYYALEGVSQLMQTINLVKGELNDRLELSTVLLTMFDACTKLAAQVVRPLAHGPASSASSALAPSRRPPRDRGLGVRPQARPGIRPQARRPLRSSRCVGYGRSTRGVFEGDRSTLVTTTRSGSDRRQSGCRHSGRVGPIAIMIGTPGLVPIQLAATGLRSDAALVAAPAPIPPFRQGP